MVKTQDMISQHMLNADHAGLLRLKTSHVFLSLNGAQYLDGYPAALIRIVSSTPQALSCCTVLLGSNLTQSEWYDGKLVHTILNAK